MTRDEFRNAVFARDGGRCVVCKGQADAAHHILERRLWEDEGYYVENGASLCPRHHIEAEQTTLSCEDIRAAAGITVVALPEYFDWAERYDKWGNVFLPNGLRVRGDLFFDESVQAILSAGGVLGQFTKYVKFPKIPHLPWSPGVDPDSDRVLTDADVEELFVGREVVITEKVDGENTSMYGDYVHARSLDSRNHPSRNWVKNLHARVAHEIPDGWRICGENVFAEHSIHYNGLPSYFLVFAMYSESNECLSWDDTMSYAEMLGLSVVPVLWRGTYDGKVDRQMFTGRSRFGGSQQEGYVVRLAQAIPWRGRKAAGFAKFVRKGHVQTAHNWMNREMVRNDLA